MDDKQKETRLSLWEQYRAASYRRWRVYSTFLTGLAIGFLFVVILSNREDSTFFDAFIDPRTLVLLFSGILGGVIYTILVDGHVEMPRFVANKGDQFEAGLFGDILLGIAGAVVADFLTQEVLNTGQQAASDASAQGEVSYIAVAAVGIIGGYGGRAILQFALNRMFSDINVLEGDRQKYLKAAYQQRAEAQEGLKIIDQLNQHIQTGLTNSALAELVTAIRQASTSVRKQVFDLTKNFRQTANSSDESKARIQRTIPIFSVLTEAEPDNHGYYAQLAYAYKDSGSPDLLKAIQYLDRAIELRGDERQDETWKYELCRAITRIQQEHKNKGIYDFDTAVNDRIVADLLAVARIYNLENILKAAEERNIPVPVWEWMRANQKMLEAREDTKDFVVKLAGSIGGVKPGSSTESSSEVVDDIEPSYQEWMVAVRDTWLKKLPDQTSTLSVHEKHFCPVGTKYPVESYEAAPNNHYFVKLGYGAGEWYIYDSDFQNHWDRSWEKPREPLQQSERNFPDHSVAISVSTIPQKAIDLIKEFEGYEKELSDGSAAAYEDPIHGWKVATIGYGTTKYPDGRKVNQGDIISRKQAEEYLIWEIEEKCKPILERIPTWAKMNSNQKAAIYSFAYNLGSYFYRGKNFESITRVCDSPEKWSDKQWVTEQFIKYRNPGTSAEVGLRRRRIAEANLFCEPVSFTMTGKTELKNIVSEKKQDSREISTTVSLSLSGSVGSGGVNNSKDVVAVKERLTSLGFNFFPTNDKKDQGLVDAINLFQSIIHGRTNRAGDGRIDVDGKTHTYLNSANAPRWIELPIEGPGFVNHERKSQPWDDHDYGTNWISEVIVQAGKHYEENYRKGNSSIALIAINDVSRPQGGFTKDHSGHECGNACDLLLPHKGGGFGSNNWRSGNYDQNATRAQLQALKAHKLVTTVYFNDPVLQKEGLCSHCGGHDDHIHFEIGVKGA